MRALIFSGMLLGIGLGGWLEGILFHLILQSHGMITGLRPSDTLAHSELNGFWNGVFQVFSWTATALGVRFLWTVARQSPAQALSGRVFLGSILLGWGAFTVVEGVINHHLLGLHHVVERLGTSMFDLAWIGYGLALSMLGVALVRDGVAGRQRYRFEPNPA